MKTKIILIKPAPRKRNWLRALYIITKRKLRKINDEKLIVILCAAVFLLQLFIMVTAIAAPLHASEKQVPAKSAGLQIGDTRLNDTVGQARMKGLQIGQEVPDVTIANIINYKTPTAKISDFKGKLLILDFWATWCGSCVSKFPKTDSLQRAYGDRVQFLLVNSIKGTGENRQKVETFLKKWEQSRSIKLSMPFAVEDTVTEALFPRIYLPHYVWIGPDQRVKAITSAAQITRGNILRALNQGIYDMPQKLK